MKSLLKQEGTREQVKCEKALKCPFVVLEKPKVEKNAIITANILRKTVCNDKRSIYTGLKIAKRKP